MHCIENAYQSILQTPMSKKYGHIWRTNQNNPDIMHQSDLMSSKEKHNWRIPAVYSPFGYDDNETRHIARKNSAINPFVVKSVLEYKCKLFRHTAYEKTPEQKPDADLEKTHSN